MSRTYKDIPSRIRFPKYWERDREMLVSTRQITKVTNLDWDTMEFVTTELEQPYERVHYSWIDLPTTKPKQRKRVDTENHWMSTPSWWTRLMMNKPQRRRAHVWERKALLEDLEETDPPGVSHKPHWYYW